MLSDLTTDEHGFSQISAVEILSAFFSGIRNPKLPPGDVLVMSKNKSGHLSALNLKTTAITSSDVLTDFRPGCPKQRAGASKGRRCTIVALKSPAYETYPSSPP
jgi:hypothetical protein